jgi:hypothetical protein
MSAILIIDAIILISAIRFVPDKAYGIFLCGACLGIAWMLIKVIHAFYQNGFLEIKHN